MTPESAAHSVAADSGPELYALLQALFPICRSITGSGVRQTFEALSRIVPLQITEVPSGTEVLDWKVPKEWNIRDAWIADSHGRRVVDFRTSNLHVVNYSTPLRRTMSLAELRPHLHTLPNQPDLVPYRTSYYQESWGFCLAHRTLEAMPEGDYEVCIDATLEPGSLTYAEFVVPGESDDEILISAHSCHPSLCNDNLTAVVIAAFLARAVASGPKLRCGVRFLLAPGTIGGITWLALNGERAKRIRHGLTLTCLGDDHGFTFKKTLDGDTELDRAVTHVLATSGMPYSVIDFHPFGADERQYSSPGFRIPVGSFMRSGYGSGPEYHTSADNLSYVSGERMGESLAMLRSVIDVLGRNATYTNLAPFGEPQLGRRGLYQAFASSDVPDFQTAVFWVLSLSDNRHTLLDIARRSHLQFRSVRAAADLLVQHGLLAETRTP